MPADPSAAADPAKRERFHALPAAVVVMENAWPDGSSTGWHSHPREQLLYATEGVMVVRSDAGAWVVPPNRALWLLAGVRHEVTMAGAVLMRTAYVDAARFAGLPRQSCALNVSPLLRELLVAAVRIAPGAPPTARDARLLALLLDEVHAAPTLALHLPTPRDARLRRVCDALAARPAQDAGAAAWACSVGVAERTLHRLFVAELGMTFARWREQARLLHALRRLAEGAKVIDVALDCGYASPSAFTAMFRRHFGSAPSAFYR